MGAEKTTKWQKVMLRDLCSKIQYGYTEKASSEPIGPKFLRITDIVSDTINWEEVPYCAIPDEKCDLYSLKQGDIVIARTGATTGYAKYLKNIPRSVFASYLVRLQVMKEVEPRYIGFIVESKDYKDFIKTNIGGSAQPNANAQILTSYMLNLPNRSTQQKIAAILSAYDDLIENNLRRIKILEEMAQNLYREWFVHFRFPGHENTRFVDSELGKIPEGWEVKRLGELLYGHIGGGWGKEEQFDKYSEPAWVIRGTDIPNAKKSDISNVPFRYHTISNLKNRKLLPGDIIFEVSGGSKDQPLGRVLLISSELMRLFKGNPVICASFCKRIQPNHKLYAPELLYLSFIESYGSGEIEQYQVQSTGISNFRWSDYLEKAFRCVPPRSIQDDFREIIMPIFSQISVLGLQCSTLRQTRDLLLPKLISGEVDVSELDIKVPKEAAF